MRLLLVRCSPPGLTRARRPRPCSAGAARCSRRWTRGPRRSCGTSKARAGSRSPGPWCSRPRPSQLWPCACSERDAADGGDQAGADPGADGDRSGSSRLRARRAARAARARLIGFERARPERQRPPASLTRLPHPSLHLSDVYRTRSFLFSSVPSTNFFEIFFYHFSLFFKRDASLSFTIFRPKSGSRERCRALSALVQHEAAHDRRGDHDRRHGETPTRALRARKPAA